MHLKGGEAGNQDESFSRQTGTVTDLPTKYSGVLTYEFNLFHHQARNSICSYYVKSFLPIEIN